MTLISRFVTFEEVSIGIVDERHDIFSMSEIEEGPPESDEQTCYFFVY